MKRYITTLLLLVTLILPLPAQAKGGVVLNFSDVDIATMVKFISDLTGKNFVMDERVKGKISVYSPTKLSTEEAFAVFTSVLELKGFTPIQVGKVYKIVPTAQARQSGTRLLGDQEKGPVNDSYVARVITVDNIPAQDAVTFLQPMISKDGHISAFGPANMLLVVDSAANIQKLLGILQLIDAEKPREGAEVVFLKNAAADNLAKVVQEWLIGRAAKATPQPGAPTATTGGIVVADSRLNALVVFGSDRDKEDVKKLVALLDVVPPTTSSKVNVYYLENADATEVAKVLDGMIKGAAATPGAPGQPGTAPQQAAFEGGKIAITPDKATNSLVVMASPNDYQNLLQVIQKLDRRRRQVFVEATIAEVSLTKLKELGVNWGFFGGSSNGTVATVGVYDSFNAITPVQSLLQGLISAGAINKAFDLGTSANFVAVLKALDSTGAVNVLSTPNILTSDNKEAEIFVGENVPFRGKVDISTTTNPSFQSVDRKDTGIILRITPQISEGDYVKLDIYQEISAVKPTLDIKAVDITTTKRSAKTSVVVKSTDVVVIGGLISERDDEKVDKVPFLGDIPLLGWFFKSKSTTKEKINLLITLQPHIIKDARDLARLSEQQSTRFTEKSGQSMLEPAAAERKAP